jgi:hypothetical protein
MAKITRKLAKIFGSNAGVDQRAVIGSLFAGSSAFSTDPETIQSLSNYLDGWESVVIGGNSPAIEDMNALHFVFAYQLAYLMQTGLPEWNIDTVYYIGSLVNNGTGKIYQSLTDANEGNAVSDTTNWKLIAGNVLTTLGDLLYATTDGNLARLAGQTAANKYFLTQTGTGSVSAAPVWQQQKVPTVQRFLSGSGTYSRPSGCLYIKVKAVGAGGGGGGSGTTAGSAAGDGGNTTFGASLTAGGGVKGAGGLAAGGVGGSNTISGLRCFRCRRTNRTSRPTTKRNFRIFPNSWRSRWQLILGWRWHGWSRRPCCRCSWSG